MFVLGLWWPQAFWDHFQTIAASLHRLAAFDTLARFEAILPALESSHAIAKALELAASRPCDEVIVVCLSGRGDKDAFEVARLRKEAISDE